VQPVLLQSGQTLRIWEPIEIIVGSEPDTGRYRSRIEDFINGGIVITSPEFVAGHTLLRYDVDVTVNVVRDDAVYQFHTKIRRHATSSGRFLILTPPRKIRRVQRRRFVRIEMLANVSYARIKPTMDWDDYDERLSWQMTRTVDISGGGILIKLIDKEEVKHDGELYLLKIDFFRTNDLPEKVVGVCRRTFVKNDCAFAGLEMLTVDQLRDHFTPGQTKKLPPEVTSFDRRAQDKLVNHIFNKQIELRNKGLL
jgi:c-di-GMP-binding flagellar brake protein YcgR